VQDAPLLKFHSEFDNVVPMFVETFLDPVEQPPLDGFRFGAHDRFELPHIMTFAVVVDVVAVRDPGGRIPGVRNFRFIVATRAGLNGIAIPVGVFVHYKPFNGEAKPKQHDRVASFVKCCPSARGPLRSEPNRQFETRSHEPAKMS
jgi:hypothetical protein